MIFSFSSISSCNFFLSVERLSSKLATFDFSALQVSLPSSKAVSSSLNRGKFEQLEIDRYCKHHQTVECVVLEYIHNKAILCKTTPLEIPFKLHMFLSIFSLTRNLPGNTNPFCGGGGGGGRRRVLIFSGTAQWA